MLKVSYQSAASESTSAAPSAPRSTQQLALDADLMLSTEARRFFCVMQELTGGSVLLGAQARREVWLRIADVSRRSAERTMEGMLAESGRLWTAPDQARIEELAWACAQDWRRWMESERDRNDAVWRTGASPLHAGRLQSALMGSGALAGRRGRAEVAMVVAETVLSGAGALVVSGMSGLRTAVLNQWLERRQASDCHMLRGLPLPFVMEPDEAVAARCASVAPIAPVGDLALRWAVGACAPPPSDSESTWSGVLQRFLDGLRRAGFAATAQAAAAGLVGLQERRPLDWAEVLSAQAPLARRTWDSENRRLVLPERP